ncbi:MAG: isoleucine--tRNA ligase [Opitutaceae bacterium]
MAQDYKDTLNLPRTDFPMRANLTAREPKRLAHWESIDVYHRALEKNRDGPSFVLHDGPPFTNGHVHIGTALNKILKDTIVRFHLARGHHAPYIPGWDCHGLPIEAKVTRELQEKGQMLETPELREACAAFSRSYMETMRPQFARLGVLADWAAEYRTMDPAYEATVLRTFAAFVEQGLVYRSKKPVYWSIPCETALAEAEIEYKDHLSPSIWVRFGVTDPSKLGIDGKLSAVIWTTTPWTLPANLAIAVHPALDYSVLRHGDEHFLVASALAERFATETGLGNLSEVRTIRGAELEHLETRHPFIDRASPIVLAEYVTTEAGTGCVHTAPGHGLEDYQTGLAYGLDIYCPLDDKGAYVDDGRIPADLVGLSVLENDGWSDANKAVLRKLEATGSLVKLSKLKHSYPHCWRSKTPVVFRAMDQWFISVDHDGLRQRALKALGEVEWIPAWGENRIRGAVESKPDWCISRQRQWGVPIPAFFDDDGNALLDAGVIRGIADKVEQAGVNLWFRESPEELLSGIELPGDWKSRPLHKGTDTLDVWIESGSSHLAVLKSRGLPWPADLYLEGSDQHRGWFQSSLWTGMVVAGHPPYRKILTHGFVVGQDGRKISKSDGKPQTADTFINKYGADVIRLWVASTDFRNDIPVSEEILGHIGETYRLFRNTLRFQVSNLFDFELERHAVEPAALDPIDQWALAKTDELLAQATDAFGKIELHRVYQLCNQFCSVTLSSLYHDILKDRLYTLAPDDPLRRSSQTAIHRIFTTLIRVLAPILPFTCDEAWSYHRQKQEYGNDALILHGWPDAQNDRTRTTTMIEIDEILQFRGRIYEKLEQLRQAGSIGKSLEAAVTIRADTSSPLSGLLTKYRESLPEIFIVSQVHLVAKDGGEPEISTCPAEGDRCPRCWRTLEPIDPASSDPLCPRCAAATEHP